MIEQHYGDSRMSHAELDALIDDARDSETPNLSGTPSDDEANDISGDR